MENMKHDHHENHVCSGGGEHHHHGEHKHHGHHHKHEGCCGGHHHHKHEGCCGGHHHKHHGPLTQDEISFLKSLTPETPLPIVQFSLSSTKSQHINSLALSPVFLKTKEDSIEQIKEIGAVIKSLEERDFIEVDYDTPLEKALYEMFFDSSAYKTFCETVEMAKSNENFLFDSGEMELGSLVLTLAGIDALKAENV